MAKMKIHDMDFESIQARKTWPKDETFPEEGAISSDFTLEAIRKVKEDLREIDFTYRIQYDPNVAHMKFEGQLLVKAGSSALEEKGDLDEGVINFAVRRASVQAIKISETLNVPPPLLVGGAPEEEREIGREYG